MCVSPWYASDVNGILVVIMEASFGRDISV